MNPAEQWIESEDEKERESRSERLSWIAELYPRSEYVRFVGGSDAKRLFEECRYCFVYGQYLAAIMLGLAFVERTLAAEMYAAGRNDIERASISTLLTEALRDGWITEDEHQALDQARELRNAVTHFRTPGHPERFEFRAILGNELPYDVMERDARHVIEAVFSLLARGAV